MIVSFYKELLNANAKIVKIFVIIIKCRIEPIEVTQINSRKLIYLQ